MQRKIYFVLVFLIFCIASYSQKPDLKAQRRQERKQHIAELIKREEEGSLIYNKQWLLGFKLNTDGWTALYEHGKYKSISTTNTWFLEIGERKSHKEEKLTRNDDTGFPIGNPLIYGKQNVFYNVNLGFGQQKLIGGKGTKNGVAVSAVYGGGFSLGLLKPYYVTAIDGNNQTHDVRYTGNSPDDTLFLFYPFSGAGFSKGFNQMKVVPGLVAHSGLRFDYGRFNEILSAIEVGVSAEYYTKEMPIMALAKPKKFFYNAYVAIEFGKRK